MHYLTDNVLSILSIVLPIIASLCVITVLAVNIYLKIRRRIPAKVNCWFCNEWTKVHYDNRNSFDCPTCLQYNGFDVDGGYNKIIPAQCDELLNHRPFPPHTRNTVKASNGLCRICNNNQQLKIYQLANFVPLNEDKFDVEIEHFRIQLEKAYKLCKNCDNVVKRTITHQNKGMLGLKLSNLRKHGLSLLDLENSFNGLPKNTKQSYFLYFVNFIIFFFTLMILMNALYNIDFSNEVLNKHFPSYIAPYISLVKNIFSFVLNATRNGFSNIVDSNEYKTFEKSFHLHEKVLDVKDSLVNLASKNYFKSEKIDYFKQYINASAKTMIPTRPDLYYVCFSGLLMQAVDYTLNKRKRRFTKFMQILLWVVHIATWRQYSEETAFFINMFQIVASVSMLYYTCVIKETKKQEVQKPNNCSVFLTKNSEYTPYVSLEKRKPSLKTSRYMETYSDTDTAESDCSNESIISTSTKKFTKIRSKHTSSLNTGNYVFGQAARFGNTLNKSALSFEELNASSSESNESFITTKSHLTEKLNHTITHLKNFDADINKSLDNLHLGGSLQNTSFSSLSKQNVVVVNSNVIRPRPILSPPKLKNINQNSWTAGGFWKNYKSPIVFDGHNMSRSSSQTSGFVSQCNEPMVGVNKFNSLPPSRNNSSYGDFERSSLMSEPAYHCTLTEHNLRERNEVDFKPINNLDGRVYSSSASLQNYPNKINDYLRDLNGSMYSTNYNTGKMTQLTPNFNTKENFRTINMYDRFKMSMETDDGFHNKNDTFANDFCNLSVQFDNINKTNPFKPLKEL